MLAQQAAGDAQIAKETGLTRQTVYRIKGDPAGADQRNGRDTRSRSWCSKWRHCCC
jgi:DNA invertase Pin-like site-specific DNA recombinase